MYCSNCGKQTSGKFCSNCGQPLPTIDNQPSGDTKKWSPKDSSLPKGDTKELTADSIPENTEQLRFSKVDQAVQRRSQSSVAQMEKSHSSTPIRNQEDHAGKAQVHKTVVKQAQQPSQKSILTRKNPKTKRTVDTRSRIFSLFSLAGSAVSTILRYLSLGLMVILTLSSATGFWSEKDTLGNIFQMVEESNHALYAFSALAGFLLLFGTVSCLWILSRRKIADGKKMRRYDTGRGLVSFLFFGLITLLAKTLLVQLPSDSAYFQGIKAVLQVFFVHRTLNLTLCLGGIVCCVLRGVKFH